MLKASIQSALKGRVCVLAFPNINLVNENHTTLLDMIEKDNNVILYIDEVQIPLKDIQKNIPLTRITRVSKTNLELIKAGRLLEDAIKNEMLTTKKLYVKIEPIEATSSAIYAENKIVGGI